MSLQCVQFVFHVANKITLQYMNILS